ncbi:hypothetical protein [Brevundimonas sp. 357]|uniref:hypothetical protein n=1 Tax=Brevundimonas sp. 357 TaxID=2555782 RepID=UPI000F772992|nr:hypothetical protein [Brevundimonas sp. 357]RSB46263.1 hypothetical protein EGK63_07200 [Brevundimonas sp. 357]
MKRILIATVMVMALATPVLSQDPDPVSDNPEMAAILAADQVVRQDLAAVLAGGREGALRIHAADAVRRQQVRSLLEAGALRTATDFYSAALVFQHGDTPEDYLMAHTLAVAALGERSTESPWLAAATLDRYLQAVGQPQIYGTQTMMRRGEQPTREPFNHALIPDSIRRVLAVSTRAAEEARLAAQTATDGAPTPR